MRISYKETAQIADSLGELLGAGVRQQRIFEVIMKYRSKRAQRALQTVRDTVEQGLPFSEGFRRSAWAWPPYFIEMTRCAEMAGQLQAGFREGAEHFKKMVQIKRAFSRLWLTPLIIIVGFWIIQALILYHLGGSSSALMFLRAKAEFSSVMAIIVLGFLYLPPLRRLLDMVVIHIPLIAELVRDLEMYRFTTCFQYLYIGAVSAPDILRNAAKAVVNSDISRRISSAAETVEQGIPFSEALKPVYYWPPGYIYSLAVAEESGQLQDMLGRLAQQCKEVLESRIDKTVKITHQLLTYLRIMIMALMIMRMRIM